jgi:hypothetical protein
LFISRLDNDSIDNATPSNEPTRKVHTMFIEIIVISLAAYAIADAPFRLR